MISDDATLRIAAYSVMWAGLLLIALRRSGGKSTMGTVGLPLAFIASYMSAHSGALVHLVAGYDHFANDYLRSLNYTRDTVADGLEASCLAMVAATVGFAAVDLALRPRASPTFQLPPELLRKASLAFMIVGLGIFLVATMVARAGITFPGLQAVIYTVQNLFVVGACGWVLHRYIIEGSLKAMIWAGGLAIVMPVVLLISTAILADSIVLAIAISTFYLGLPATRHRAFLRNLLVLMFSMACAFAFAIFYMQARGALREIVWGGGSIEAGLGSVAKSAGSFDFASSTDQDTLAMLDARLNQNIFVGLAIERLRSFPGSFENGATIEVALFAWVPRALWPDKPERGGSTFISKHTGLEFAGGTTFGAGPIFEFYVNFGYTGVFFGFLIVGGMMRALDIAAVKALGRGDMANFAQFQLAGLSLLQPLADLFYVMSGFATALLVGWAARVAWRYWVRSRAAVTLRIRR